MIAFDFPIPFNLNQTVLFIVQGLKVGTAYRMNGETMPTRNVSHDGIPRNRATAFRELHHDISTAHDFYSFDRPWGPHVRNHAFRVILGNFFPGNRIKKLVDDRSGRQTTIADHSHHFIE